MQSKKEGRRRFVDPAAEVAGEKTKATERSFLALLEILFPVGKKFWKASVFSRFLQGIEIKKAYYTVGGATTTEGD
jgi:hypothetical protein